MQSTNELSRTVSAFLILTWRQTHTTPPKRWRHYLDAIQSAMFREQDKAWGFHSNNDRLASDIVGKVGVWLPTFSTNTLPYPCAIKHRTWRPRSEQSCFVAGRSRIQIRLRHLRSPASLRAVLQSLRAEAWPVPSLRPRWFFHYSSLTSSYYAMLYSTVIQFIYSACHSWGVKERIGRGLATIQGQTAGAALERYTASKFLAGGV